MRGALRTVQRRAAIAPPLKWAGGKRWLLAHLERLWEPEAHRRLVEPFMGGLAVALGLGPEHALLNDANPHVVNFYRQLRDGLKISLKMSNDEETYYALRNRFNALAREGQAFTADGAQLFYYLNRTGFNGLCRFNKRGEFNVPMGRYATIDYEDSASLKRYSGVLDGWEFADADFEHLDLESNDFVYADPPYDDAFTGYNRGGFAWADQERLATWLADHDGPVVASNHATDRIKGLYRHLGFAIHQLDAPRRISCTGDRTEIGRAHV